jgi:hypothetical protein
MFQSVSMLLQLQLKHFKHLASIPWPRGPPRGFQWFSGGLNVSQVSMTWETAPHLVRLKKLDFNLEGLKFVELRCLFSEALIMRGTRGSFEDMK